MCSIAHWCPTLCYPMDCRNHQASLSMGFSRQEYWSRLPFPTSGDLLDPGIEPVSPAMTGGFFTTLPPELLRQTYLRRQWARNRA